MFDTNCLSNHARYRVDFKRPPIGNHVWRVNDHVTPKRLGHDPDIFEAKINLIRRFNEYG